MKYSAVSVNMSFFLSNTRVYVDHNKVEVWGNVSSVGQYRTLDETC